MAIDLDQKALERCESDPKYASSLLDMLENPDNINLIGITKEHVVSACFTHANVCKNILKNLPKNMTLTDYLHDKFQIKRKALLYRMLLTYGFDVAIFVKGNDALERELNTYIRKSVVLHSWGNRSYVSGLLNITKGDFKQAFDNFQNAIGRKEQYQEQAYFSLKKLIVYTQQSDPQMDLPVCLSIGDRDIYFIASLWPMVQKDINAYINYVGAQHLCVTRGDEDADQKKSDNEEKSSSKENIQRELVYKAYRLAIDSNPYLKALSAQLNQQSLDVDDNTNSIYRAQLRALLYQVFKQMSSFIQVQFKPSHTPAEAPEQEINLSEEYAYYLLLEKDKAADKSEQIKIMYQAIQLFIHLYKTEKDKPDNAELGNYRFEEQDKAIFLRMMDDLIKIIINDNGDNELWSVLLSCPVELMLFTEKLSVDVHEIPFWKRKDKAGNSLQTQAEQYKNKNWIKEILDTGKQAQQISDPDSLDDEKSHVDNEKESALRIANDDKDWYGLFRLCSTADELNTYFQKSDNSVDILEKLKQLVSEPQFNEQDSQKLVEMLSSQGEQIKLIKDLYTHLLGNTESIEQDVNGEHKYDDDNDLITICSDAQQKNIDPKLASFEQAIIGNIAETINTSNINTADAFSEFLPTNSLPPESADNLLAALMYDDTFKPQKAGIILQYIQNKDENDYTKINQLLEIYLYGLEKSELSSASGQTLHLIRFKLHRCRDALFKSIVKLDFQKIDLNKILNSCYNAILQTHLRKNLYYADFFEDIFVPNFMRHSELSAKNASALIVQYEDLSLTNALKLTEDRSDKFIAEIVKNILNKFHAQYSLNDLISCCVDPLQPKPRSKGKFALQFIQNVIYHNKISQDAVRNIWNANSPEHQALEAVKQKLLTVSLDTWGTILSSYNDTRPCCLNFLRWTSKHSVKLFEEAIDIVNGVAIGNVASKQTVVDHVVTFYAKRGGKRKSFFGNTGKTMASFIEGELRDDNAGLTDADLNVLQHNQVNAPEPTAADEASRTLFKRLLKCW